MHTKTKPVGEAVQDLISFRNEMQKEKLIQSLGGYSVQRVAIGLIYPFQQDYRYLQAL